MAKFGELIDLDIPVLINFYKHNNPGDAILNKLAQEVGEKAKIVKIDVNANKKLSEALKIDSLPTFLIYKKGEMLWRKAGEQKEEKLLAMLQNYW